MTVKRISFNDNVRADVGSTSVWRSGTNGDIEVKVGESALIIYGGTSADAKVTSLSRLKDLGRAIEELIHEVDMRGDRT